jgi:hypothetical protein
MTFAALSLNCPTCPLYELFTLDQTHTGSRSRLTLHVHELGYELRLDVNDGPVRSQVTPDACWIKAIVDEWRTAMLAEGWS